MDLRKRYRSWLWKRLAFLLPSFLAALGGIGWLGAYHPFALFLRIPCLTIAVVLTGQVAYMLVETLDAALRGHRRHHQEARAHRRHLHAWAPLLGLSLSVLALLVSIPVLFPGSAAPPPPFLLAVEGKRSGTPPSSEASSGPLPLQREEEAAPLRDGAELSPGLSSSAPVASAPPSAPVPAPVPPPVPTSISTLTPTLTSPSQGNPEIRPELALEPAHLVLDEPDLHWSGLLEIPVLKTPPQGSLTQELPKVLPTELVKELPKAPAQEPSDAASDEQGAPPFRLDRELQAAWPRERSWLLGIAYRPLPEELDSESWPAPEGRVEGFLLLGSGGDRVPGLALLMDLPLSRRDSVLVSWTGARLPEQQGQEASAKPNWDHVSLGYFRRVAGFTQQATFDLGVSLGVSADFFHAVEGVADSGGTPKFAPYAAIDLGFWQREPIGLLLHFSQAFPVTVVGSSLGMTDMSAQIRWDLSERISLHGGYRIVLLRYKFDGDTPTAASDRLRESLSGPILGLDIRF